MPSNHVLINNSIEYIVVDSRMDDFLSWLMDNGHRVNTGLKKEPNEIILDEVTSNTLIES